MAVDMDNEGVEPKGFGGWSKGKRTRRVKVGYSNSSEEEEEDMANCLVMLSTARVDRMVEETEMSCASAIKDKEERPRNKAKGMFECKSCKKVFGSHQALGGHRASHKKVKGCFASKIDGLDESMVEEDVIQPLDHDLYHKRKSKVHECSICHRIFSSGQALGGHKRCHWVTSNSTMQQRPRFNQSEPLDLNLPAPVDDQSPLHLQLKSTFYLQQWIGVHPNDNNIDTHNNISSSNLHLDDETDRKIKVAKLSDLNDMNLGGESLPWLQVGIGLASNGTNDQCKIESKEDHNTVFCIKKL